MSPMARFSIKNFLLPLGFCGFLVAPCCVAAEDNSAEAATGPEALRKTLHPFYRQHVIKPALIGLIGFSKRRKTV